MGPFQEQRPLERSGPNPAMLQNFDSAYFLDRFLKVNISDEE